MTGRLTITQAAARFDTYAERALELQKRCSATWGHLEAAGREKSEFPEFFELLGELAPLHMGFPRYSSFLKNYDPDTDEVSRLTEHIEAAKSLPSWWSNFERKAEAEIRDVEARLNGASPSEASV